MKKKILIIIPIVLVVAAAVYFFVIAAPPKKAEVSYYSPGDPFVTNIKDSARLVKVAVQLEITTTETEKDTAFLTDHNQKIRDTIVFTMRSKTETELRADDVKNSLCKELIDNLNQELGINYITNIYFTDYIVQ